MSAPLEQGAGDAGPPAGDPAEPSTAGVPAPAEGRPPLLRRITWQALTSWGVVTLALLLPVPGLWRYQGPPMEEGFMLAFPQRILAGDLPHIDFLHLYGPGSLYVLAAAYRLFGDTLQVERTVGLAQHALLVYAMLAALRPWGRLPATFGALTTLVITISPLGLSAMAWNGALGFAVLGLALLSHLLTAAPRHPARWSAGAGASWGVALLYRPDMALAIGLAIGAAWWISRSDEDLRSRRRPFVVALAATLALIVPFLIAVGPRTAFEGMFLQPVFDLRGGRSLPVPPSWAEPDGYLQKAGGLRISSWPLPMPGLGAQINLWFWLVPISTLGVAALAIGALRRPDPSRRAQFLFVAAAFDLGLIGQALQRPDTAHLSWVTCVSFALVPVALLETWKGRSVDLAAANTGRSATRAGAEGGPFDLRSTLAATAPIALVLLVVIPFYPLRTYADLVGQSFGHNVFGAPMRRDERVFYYGSAEDAAGAQEIIDLLADRSRPGERLLVGPYDLSKTPYSDAFFYYLFPELTPATRFIEMDPGLADAEGSGLLEDTRSADWIIQSDVWTGWTEANDSRSPGSDEPNQVVEQEFCLVREAARFRLLRRCAAGERPDGGTDGESATVTGG